MSIIVSHNGKNAKKIEKSSFDKEGYLQQYIYDNPDIIPLYDIKEEVRLLILCREFPTTSGPIDAIGVDRDGELYIVETKLYRNPDKRTVVAQAMDYGAALWRHADDFDSFVQILEQGVQKTFGINLREKLVQFFSLSDEEIAIMLDAMKTRLNDGSFRFVILMDQLESRLKDLILYVNQNSQFDIYAVELEYCKHEEQEILIPRIFGAEVKKDVGVSSSSGSLRRRWNEQSFFEVLRDQLESRHHPAVKRLYDFSVQSADAVRWGTGMERGSFNPVFSRISTRSPYTVWTDGTLTLNFEWLHHTQEAQEFRERLKQSVEDKLSFPVPDNYREHHVSYIVRNSGRGRLGSLLRLFMN